MTQSLEDFFLSYHNGNLSWCRDEFWGSTKAEMRSIMLQAPDELEDEYAYQHFIKVIFLP